MTTEELYLKNLHEAYHGQNYISTGILTTKDNEPIKKVRVITSGDMDDFKLTRLTNAHEMSYLLDKIYLSKSSIDDNQPLIDTYNKLYYDYKLADTILNTLDTKHQLYLDLNKPVQKISINKVAVKNAVKAPIKQALPKITKKAPVKAPLPIVIEEQVDMTLQDKIADKIKKLVTSGNVPPIDFDNLTKCSGRSTKWTIASLKTLADAINVKLAKTKKGEICAQLLQFFYDNKIPINGKLLTEANLVQTGGATTLHRIVIDLINNPVDDPHLEIELRLHHISRPDLYDSLIKQYDDYMNGL